MKEERGGDTETGRRGDTVMMMKVLKLVLMVVVTAATAAAQQPGNPTNQQGVTPPRGTYVIRNARIVTVSGADIENGSIVIRDGKIEASARASMFLPARKQSMATACQSIQE